EPDASRRTELGESLEDITDGVNDGFIGMKQDLAVGFTPDKAHGQATPQFTAFGLITNTAVEPRTNDMQFGFAHRPLESQQKAVIEQCRVIDAVIVTNQSVGQATQFQQAIPIDIVARQARDLEAENDPHVT